MTITVFMACYNASKYLREAIESILNQTYSDFEFLIIDDGSTDNSLEIIKEYAANDNRIRIEQNDKNRGVSYTRNRGLELAGGEWLAIMDADDIAPLNRLQICIEYINSHPDIDAVFGNYQLMAEDGTYGKQCRAKKWESVGKALKAAMFFRNIISNGTSMFRLAVIRDNNLSYSMADLEDYLLCVQFFDKTDRIIILPDVLQYYRVVSTGLSRSNSKQNRKDRDERFKAVHDEILKLWDIKLSDEAYRIYIKMVSEGYPRRNKFVHFAETKKLLCEIVKKSNHISDKELMRSLRKQCRFFITR